MLENIHLAFEGIWSHKLRSILTMLGIIIGIAAIITIVSTIKGTNEQIKENLIGAGNNVVSVQLNQNGNQYDLSWSPLPDTVRVISEETRQALEDINGAEEVSLYYSRSYTDGFFYLDTPFNGNVLGVDRHYFSTYGMQIRAGRGFTEKDYTEFRKVALVDSTAAKSLFSGADPVGREIEFGSDVYTVVGVIGPAEEFTPTINSLNDYYLYANDGSGSIYFPDSLWPALYQFDEPQSVAIKVKNTDVMASVGKKAADLLTGSQIIGTDTGFDYRSADMLEQAQQLQNMSKSTNTQLIWIASISLLVGGIGVMNIMLVSVTERTREIGLKIAIGAQQSRIRWQFLTEAAVLTSMGGILGVACGIGLAEMMSHIMGTPVAISVPACIIAVAFSMVIGVVFGFVPAVKASKLNPIEALRRE